jgi:hypothetical protein
VNEVSIDDYEKAKAEKKAALAVLMKKGDAVAKVVDDSAFAGLKIGEGKADANEFSVEAGFHVKAKKEAKKETKTKQVLATGFKTAPIATDRDDRDDRDDRGGGRGGRGGRDGGRGGRDGGRGGRDGGRGGRGRGDAPRPSGGRGGGGGSGFSTKIDDASAFPTLGA